MRRIGSQRQRSDGWWAVFLCAFLAMGVYIAFEVLDVDGSNLRDMGPGTAIAAEPASADAERFLHHAPAIADAPGLVFPSIPVAFASESRQLAGQATPTTLAARQGHFLPRMHLGREVSSVTSPTEDPA
jgi:hypothetical protein